MLAAGVAVSLNSRPWECLMVMLPAGAAFLYWLWKNPRTTALRALAPCCLLLAATAGAMLYYSWRITGNPLRLPYMAAQKTYSVAPLFLWQKPAPEPNYHHVVMRRFFTEWETRYQSADKLHTWRGWLAAEKIRLRMGKDVLFTNGSLVVCALFFGFLLRRPGSRLLLAALAFFVIGLSLESWAQVHYFAPVIGAAAALKMLSLRRLSVIRVGERRLGLGLAVGLLLCGGTDLIRQLDFRVRPELFPIERDRLERTLEAQPGAQVVLVRYSGNHDLMHEWVYNRADIDGSKVVWARDMSPQEDQRLFDYFKGRHFWLLTPDVAPLRLQSLDGQTISIR
jgi:hypothetical protein